MAMSIGVDYTAENWKTCLMENGQTLELCSFVDSTAALAYVEHICARYPEPTLALSSVLRTAPLNFMTNQQLNEEPQRYSNGLQGNVNNFLIAAKSINLSSYCVPGIKQLSTVPAHRKLNRLEMGSADQLCTVAMLLYRLCEREAAWSEMNFLYLEVQQNSMSILVIEDGQIVNGISEIRLHLRVDGDCSYSFGSNHHESTYRSDWLDPGDAFVDEVGHGHAREHAFWEGLAQELAGLMAIHHCEDIVVLGQHKETVIEWFDDMYQLYHFPYKESDRQGFEAAIGAAIIAEGLAHIGLAAEVVERLQIRSAISSDVNAPALPEMREPYPQLPR
jgi:predicted butyrate kinase (DUF1464 family)